MLHLRFLLFLLCFIPSLAHAEMVKGRVVGPDGEPIVATVYWSVYDMSKAESQPKTQTAPDGTWTLDVTVREMQVNFNGSNKLTEEEQKVQGWVTIYAPGFALDGGLVRRDNVNEFRLTKPFSIEGTLNDETGKPAQNAILQLSNIFPAQRNRASLFGNDVYIPHELKDKFTAVTDAKGKWKLGGLPGASYAMVKLDDPRYLVNTAQIATDNDVARAPERPMIARLAGSITGRVVGEDGKPAMGVLIRLVPQKTSKNAAQNALTFGFNATTGADGNYKFERVPLGNYNVIILPDSAPSASQILRNLPTKTVEPTKLIAARALQNLEVQAGQTTKAPDLELQEATLVKGRVFDSETNEPLQNVLVGAFNGAYPRSNFALALALTDGEGRYEIALLPGASSLYAWEDATIWGTKPPERPDETGLEIIAGQTKTLSLKVAPQMTSVMGVVIDEEAQPVSGLKLSLGEADYGPRLVTTSDEKGNFAFPKITRKSMVLRIDYDDRNKFQILQPKEVTLPLRAGETLKVKVRRLATADLAGVVTTPDGLPIDGVMVRYQVAVTGENGSQGWSLLQAKSDKAGTFSMGAQDIGRQSALRNATKDGYKYLSGGETHIEDAKIIVAPILMAPLDRVIEGVVKNADGQPVEGALVRASGDDYESETVTDAQGKFRLPNQSSGALQIWAARGFQFGRADDKTPAVTLASAAPPRFPDVEKAKAVLQELAATKKSKGPIRNLALALAPYDPETALTHYALALQGDDKLPSPDKARLDIILQLARKGASHGDWALTEIAKMQDKSLAIEAATFFGQVLARRDKTLALPFWNAARPLLKVQKDAVSLARVASLAARLNNAEADDLAEAALVLSQTDETLRGKVLMALAPGSVERTLKGLPFLPIASQGMLFSSALIDVAWQNPDVAAQLLKHFKEIATQLKAAGNTDAPQRSWTAAYERAAKVVILNLGQSDAQAAHAIGRGIEESWSSVTALVFAASFGSKEERLALARLAQASDERHPNLTAQTEMRLAVLLADSDKQTSAAYFAGAEKKFAGQKQENGRAYGSEKLGFYLAQSDAARARFAVEAAWDGRNAGAREWQSSKPDAPIAAVMTAVDVNRALELARSLPDEVEVFDLQGGRKYEMPHTQRGLALGLIGRILLTPPDERWLFSWGDENDYNF